MAVYPVAAWRPLPEADREPLITASQIILHTAVSGAASLWGYFARADVTVESHFYVNQTGVEQYVDTARQADANRDANVRAVSIETWDGADPAHTPWTPTQMDLLVDLVAWCCATHGIPPVQCATPTSPGIGWHVMWGAPGPWTPSAGKTCPGGPRIAQVPELIARVQSALNPQEDDMPLTDTDLANIANAVWARDVGSFATAADSAADVVRQLRGSLAHLVARAPGDVDEAELARQILAVLSPEAIAAALPDELAQQVADVLADRLAG